MKQNIVLTGLMGSGKTSVGKLLAKKLNYNFIDIDRLIEKETRMKIKTIFKKFGERYFRKLEKKYCKKVSKYKGYVISTGGGIVLDSENIKNLRKNGIIVNLRANPEVLWERVKHKKNRPLLNVRNPQKVLSRIWRARKPFYDDADIIINNTKLSVSQTVEKIIKKIQKLDL